MKLLIYLLILAGVWIIPVQGTDVGKLIPIEVIAVSEKNGTYTVRTDTGDLGQGKTLQEAFETLKDQASGVIYLDTAEYLLMEEGVEPNALRPYLKQDVKVCKAAEDLPLEGIADYLSVHNPNIKLKEVDDLGKIPSVTMEKERYVMKEK